MFVPGFDARTQYNDPDQKQYLCFRRVELFWLSIVWTIETELIADIIIVLIDQFDAAVVPAVNYNKQIALQLTGSTLLLGLRALTDFIFVQRRNNFH